MFVLRSPRSAAACTVLAALLLVAGCGRNPTDPTASDPERAKSAHNEPPVATILNPAPSSVIIALLVPPVSIQWSGEDGDGHVREYRYRLFEADNPDFPGQTDFLEFLAEEPDSVLRFYSPDFPGWTSLRADKDAETFSATYSNLVANRRYAFAVVAIDNRGDHDANLSANRNVLQLAALPSVIPPTLTFTGPFGQVTDPTVPVVVPANQPVEVHWFATPAAGSVVEGYRWAVDTGAEGEASLADTVAVISPPATGSSRLLFVEVEFDHGLRSLKILRLSFTGAAAGATSVRRENGVRRAPTS